MYFIQEKNNKVKQNEVQIDMPQKFNYFHAVQKTTRQKQSDVQTDIPREVQLLHAMRFHSQ